MAIYSNSYAVIRQRLASMVGDGMFPPATADSGSTSTLVDTDLTEADDYFNNLRYYLYVYDGANEGSERKVSDWDNATNTLTLSPAFSSAIDNTSKYELHNIFREFEYRNAVNQAIEKIGTKYLIDLVDTTTIRLTSTTSNDGDTVYTWEYALPSDAFYIHRIITEDYETGKKITGTVSGTFTVGETVEGSSSGATGIFRYQGSDYILVRDIDGNFTTSDTITGATSGETVSSITAIESEEVGKNRWQASDEIDPRDWSIVKQGSSSVLKLHEDHYSIIEDLYLRLEYQGIQDTVSDDDDIIYLPPDWVCWQAVLFLPLWKLEHDKLEALRATAEKMVDRCEFRHRNYPYPFSKKVVE